MTRPLLCLVSIVLLSTTGFRTSAAQGQPPASVEPEIRSEPQYGTPLRLFATVEEAWAASDADRLAALVDTTRVKIAIKPGAPLAAAITRVAAAFLLKDQLRMVQTKSFHMVRFQCETKNRVCRATGLWNGDWGGRQGVRTVRVSLTARPSAGGWLLSEIRAED